MNLRGIRMARVVAAAAVTIAVLAEPLLGASPAFAGTPQSPSYFNRTAVVGRAGRWTRKAVPYSQTSWLDDYRTDCSGLVSYAWGLDQSYVTWSLPEIARPIAKEDLQPGDIMLNLWKHVVLFGGWANKQHTAYLAYEQVGGQFHRAVRRVVAYPYDSGSVSLYKPYRYTGGHNLYAPNQSLPAPLIQTYAGGAPLVPSWAGPKNVQRVRIAQKRAKERLDRIHAQQRAEAAAKAKAEADRKAAAEAQAAQKRLAVKDAGAKQASEPTPLPQRTGRTKPAEPPAPVIVQLVRDALALLTPGAGR